MNRQCTCGCTEFYFTVRQTVDYNGEISFANFEDGEVSDELHEEEVVSEDWKGPYICKSCGKEYADADDIPLTDSGEDGGS